MKIEEHAVEKYISRVKDKEPNKASEEDVTEARLSITMAVLYPEHVYHGKPDMCQIHIRDNIAVPVGVEKDIEGKLYPYESVDDDLVVPTSYSDKTFRSKIEDEHTKARA